MKKIITMSLKGSIILATLAMLISVSEISCQKASASPSNTNVNTPHYTLITRVVKATGNIEIDLVDSVGTIIPIPFSPDLTIDNSIGIGAAHFNLLRTAVIYTASSATVTGLSGIIYTYNIATGVTTKFDESATSSNIIVQDAE